MPGILDALPRVPIEIARRLYCSGQVERQRPDLLAKLVANAKVVRARRHVGLNRPREDVKAKPCRDAVLDARLQVTIQQNRKDAELVAIARNPLQRVGRIAVAHEVAQLRGRLRRGRSVEVDELARGWSVVTDRHFAGRTSFLGWRHQGRLLDGRQVDRWVEEQRWRLERQFGGRHRGRPLKGRQPLNPDLPCRLCPAVRHGDKCQQADEGQTGPWHHHNPLAEERTGG